MQAIRVDEFGGPEVLKIAHNVPITQPGNTQVLIRLHASGVNAIDTYLRSGKHPYLTSSVPHIPGMEGAGIVESVGKSVAKFKAGDRVYSAATARGSYSEYTLAEEQTIGKLDDKMSFERGAAIGVSYCTAYRALFLVGKARPGQTVLIHGASGGAGVAACQIAHAYGLRVFGTAGTPEGRELVWQNGAEAVFNHTEDGYMEKILESIGEQGPDIIIEMLANVNLAKDMEIIKKYGTIVVVGSRGTIDVSPWHCLVKECIVTGVLLFNTTQDQWAEMHAAFEAGMRVGWLNPTVAQIFPLADARKAHEEILKPSGKRGKIVLKI